MIGICIIATFWAVRDSCTCNHASVGEGCFNTPRRERNREMRTSSNVAPTNIGTQSSSSSSFIDNVQSFFNTNLSCRTRYSAFIHRWLFGPCKSLVHKTTKMEHYRYPASHFPKHNGFNTIVNAVGRVIKRIYYQIYNSTLTAILIIIHPSRPSSSSTVTYPHPSERSGPLSTQTPHPSPSPQDDQTGTEGRVRLPDLLWLDPTF